MLTARSHRPDACGPGGAEPTPARGASGRRPLRRYPGAGAPVGALPLTSAAPQPGDDMPFPWVDQEFEEYFFE